jgi:hypothetical protein
MRYNEKSNCTLNRDGRRKSTPQIILAIFIMLIGTAALSFITAPVARAQTNISGDIVGTVTDPQGAVIPGATVTVTSKTSNSGKTVVTDARGSYRVPLLEPGAYNVVVVAAGFEKQNFTVNVSIGGVTGGDTKLTLGASTETVEVTASEPLLHTETAQIQTSFTMDQIQSLPNPGNDLTFVAQTAPGTVMNTQMGYGNFSSFGLPATSNTFTVNGGYENDPFLNVNNSGATNLLLGNNDISDVTVISNAYDAAFGGLGGAQINEISRSGGNGYHGNATYWWNGSVLNANNYFNKCQSACGLGVGVTPRPFDNVNQWAAGMGGPIKKDKIFFFGDYEGLRVVLPTRSLVYAPSPAYQTATLASIPTAEIPLYTGLFNTWNSAPGYNPDNVDPADGNAVTYNGSAGNFTHEWLATGRVDFNLGENDKLFLHTKIDKGLQASFTSVISPVFNADSPQPQYEGQLQETHTFSPSVTNQFLFATIYYRAIFTNTSLADAVAIAPFTLIFADGDLSLNGNSGLMGGLDIIWPQGRNVTGYQFQDDVSWNKGNHTIKVGWSFRRDDVTDYSPSEFTEAPEVLATEESFQAGYSDLWFEQFPTRSTQPVALYNMGAYIQDEWKALPNLTVNYGIRLEHNSNPTCITNCFARLTTGFFNEDTSTSTPYNQLINSNLHRTFSNLQKVAYEPRVGFSWQPKGAGSSTVIRGGFGMFADAFPGEIADSLLNNAPTNVPFTVYGPAFGGGNTLLDPTLAGSAGAVATAQNSAFQAGFASGGSNASGLPAPNIVNASPHIYYPSYEEWSLAVEHQINRATALSVSYIGNHGYHEPVVGNSVNAYSPFASFGGLPAAIPNPNFGASTEVFSGASSSYNGVVASVINHSRYLTLQFNYSYSHALDEVSNGGFNGFGGNSVNPSDPYNLAANYGNADYDTRQYVSGSYVFTVPYYGGPHVLVDGWQIAGTLFHNSGFPFSVTDSEQLSNLGLQNFGGPLYAHQIANNLPQHCGGAAHTLLANPCAYYPGFVDATGLGQGRRNEFYGSSFTDTDMDVTKAFRIPGWESASLKLGAQFFNLFNHPNFFQPQSGYVGGNPASVGLITETVNTPTSILGSFLGGDASPRLIQFKASFVF